MQIFKLQVMKLFTSLPLCATLLTIAALLTACASTSVTLQPADRPAVCAQTSTALLVWTPRWRADQKDVAAREEAAAAGLHDYFSQATCFSSTQVRRLPDLADATVRAEAARMVSLPQTVVGIEVQELGPVVRLLSSAALVEGGTEVKLRVLVYGPGAEARPRSFTAHWQNGGPGVVKGVASLRADMRAALQAALADPASRL